MGKNQSNTWIKTRKSTFPNQLDPSRKINDATIIEILQHAIWAPSHKLTQPWQFVVYGPKAVGGFFDEIISIYTEGKTEKEISPTKIKKYEKRKTQVSHVVVVNMIRDPEERVPEVEEICAVSCAIQNIYLSLAPHGIAGYLSTGSIFHPRFRSYMHLSSKDACLGYFLLGIAQQNELLVERKREELSRKMKWVG